MNTEEEREDQLCTDMGEEHTSYELLNPRYPPSTVEHNEAIEGVGHLFPGGRLNHPPPRNLGEIKILEKLIYSKCPQEKKCIIYAFQFPLLSDQQEVNY